MTLEFPSLPTKPTRVCLDKWLWAARFFKTRAIARLAVEKGKVFYNGERTTPGKEIEIGGLVHISRGQFQKTITITGLSTRRRSTEETAELFEETQESFLNRSKTVNESPFDRIRSHDDY